MDRTEFKKSNPLLDNKVPSSSAQDVSDEEFEEVEWDIEHDVVEPDHAGPAPSNPFDGRECPVCVNRDQSGDLSHQTNKQTKKREDFGQPLCHKRVILYANSP